MGVSGMRDIRNGKRMRDKMERASEKKEAEIKLRMTSRRERRSAQ